MAAAVPNAGLPGLEDLPPIHKSHPRPPCPRSSSGIRALTLEPPAYGCNRLEGTLASVIIQKKLNPPFPRAPRRELGASDMLSADPFFVGSLKVVGKICLRDIVAT